MSAITILVMALLAYVSSAPSDICTDVNGYGHCEEDEWTYHPGAENAGARAFVSHEMIDGVLDHVASHVVDQLEDGFCTGDGFEGEFPLFRGGEVEFELSDVCLKSSTMQTHPSVYNVDDHSISKTVDMPLILDFDVEYKIEKKYCHRRHKKGECHRSGHVTLTVSDVELCSTFTPVRARNGIPTIRVDEFRIKGGKDIAVHITLDGEELDELSKHLLEPLGSHILQVVLPLVSDMAEVMLAKFIDHRASHHRPCGIVQPGVIYDMRIVGSHPTEFIHVNEFGVEADLSFQAAPQLLGSPFCSPWNFDPSAGPTHPLPEFKFGEEGENKIIPQYQLYISYWSMQTALQSLASVGSMSLDLVKEPEIDKKYISAEYWDKVLTEIIIPPPVPLPPIEEEEQHEEKQQHEEDVEEHEVVPEPVPLPEPVSMAFKSGGAAMKTLADMLQGGEFCEVHVVAGEEIWLHMNDLVTIMLSEEEEEHQDESGEEGHEEEHMESEEEHEEGEEHGEKWLTLTVPYSVELRRCDVESSIALVTMTFDVKVDPELRHFTKEDKWGIYRLSLALSEELKMTSAAAVTPVMSRSEMTPEGLELLKPFVHDIILPKMRESLESGLFDVHHEFKCKESEEFNEEEAESCPVEPGLMVENWPEEEVISVYCHKCFGQ